MEVSGYFHALAPLFLDISQLYTWSRRLGLIQSWPVHRGREKSVLSLSNSNLGSMVVRLTSRPKSNICYGNYVYIYIYIYIMLTEDGMCTCEIKSRIAMAKAAFNKKKNLFTSKLELNLRKRLVRCYVWSIALYGAET